MSMNNISQGSLIAVQNAHKGMRLVLFGIIANFILAGIKFTAGILGHSYALVADAIESTTDILSSLLVYVGLKISTKPADKNHPYGHGKAEPLAAFAISLFLFFAAICIAYESISRIRNPHPIPASWTLLVLFFVIIVKKILYKFSYKVAKETSSNAIKGDAFHHLSDALTSIAAFLGISIAIVGNHFNPGPYWASADDWAALAASVVVVYNGYRIMHLAIYELSDARPDAEIENEVRKVALTVPGVKELHRCRMRKMGFEYYVELDVRVDRNMPVHLAHEISHRVQDTVKEKVVSGQIARVLIHIEPSREEDIK